MKLKSGIASLQSPSPVRPGVIAARPSCVLRGSLEHSGGHPFVADGPTHLSLGSHRPFALCIFIKRILCADARAGCSGFASACSAVRAQAGSRPALGARGVPEWRPQERCPSSSEPPLGRVAWAGQGPPAGRRGRLAWRAGGSWPKGTILAQAPGKGARQPSRLPGSACLGPTFRDKAGS